MLRRHACCDRCAAALTLAAIAAPNASAGRREQAFTYQRHCCRCCCTQSQPRRATLDGVSCSCTGQADAATCCCAIHDLATTCIGHWHLKKDAQARHRQRDCVWRRWWAKAIKDCRRACAASANAGTRRRWSGPMCVSSESHTHEEKNTHTPRYQAAQNYVTNLCKFPRELHTS